MSQPFGILVVLLAPLTVAMAAWFGHVVLRGTRISEMRQKWIDDQRADLATVVSRAHVLVELAKAGSDLNETRAEALGELEAAAYRIKLRENPIKPEWTDVIDRVDWIRDHVRNPDEVGTALSSLSGAIIPSARHRLKQEWTLVRDGETSYQIASHRYWWLVGLFAIVALAIIVLGAIAGNETKAAPLPAQLDAKCMAGCYLRLR
ncbi:hypothetical protein [Sphingomonas phyllosphaerae]|uniref:hypothetical protein n=1 Tax=Sphingomonas phyllosphaerae TaxID=257003 RepID=UPI0003B4C8EB|nr:hypothetical protein [Sphingomonas phyllosphaerae]